MLRVRTASASGAALSIAVNLAIGAGACISACATSGGTAALPTWQTLHCCPSWAWESQWLTACVPSATTARTSTMARKRAMCRFDIPNSIELLRPFDILPQMP